MPDGAADLLPGRLRPDEAARMLIAITEGDAMTSVTATDDSTTNPQFWVLLTCSLVSSLIVLDSNIVAVSLPAIGRSLGASFTDIQWVISAYVLTYAALLLAAGNYADLYGRRKAMLIGLAVFAVASVACGLAPGAIPSDMRRPHRLSR